MKSILKSILTGLALLMCAPMASAQFRWGPTIGADISTLTFKQDLFDVDQVVGGSAGVVAEMMFPGIGFGIDTGLLYEQRGAKLHLGDRRIWADQGYESPRIWLHTLVIPLHLRFKWTRMNGLEDRWAPFVFGGPEFGFQVGHSRCDALKFSGGDVGLTAGVGFELWKRWQISGSYTWGMTYALKTKLLTDLSARSRTWNLRIAYLF